MKLTKTISNILLCFLIFQKIILTKCASTVNTALGMHIPEMILPLAAEDNVQVSAADLGFTEQEYAIHEETAHPVKGKIKIVKCDVSKFKVDAIIRSSDPSLKGGNTEGDIFVTMGGAEYDQYVDTTYPSGCPRGESRVTPAFNSESHFLINAVGPAEDSENKVEILQNSLKYALQQAMLLNARTIAITPFFPAENALSADFVSEILHQTILPFIYENQEGIDHIILVANDETNTALYPHLFEALVKQSMTWVPGPEPRPSFLRRIWNAFTRMFRFFANIFIRMWNFITRSFRRNPDNPDNPDNNSNPPSP